MSSNTSCLVAAAGLTRYEAEAAFSLSLVREQAIRPQSIWELKSRMLKKSGLVSLHRGSECFADLGGLDTLKSFCTRAMRNQGHGNSLKRPRGAMLLGVPGIGRNVCPDSVGKFTAPMSQVNDLDFRMICKGFTLVELVVVVLILGILAAVAVPKLIDNTDEAAEAGLIRTLAVVRDAIEMYANLNNGAYPGADGTEATFKSDLAPYIRGRFPTNQLKGSDVVDVETTGDPLGFQPGAFGWRYDNQTGQFIANSNRTSRDGVNRYWEF